MSIRLFDKYDKEGLENVWVAMQAVETRPKIGIYQMVGSSEEMRRNAMVHIGTPYPKHPRHFKTKTERDLQRFERGQYFATTHYFTRVLVHAMLDLMPQTSTTVQSRMEEGASFNALREDERIFFVKISRGGDRVTLLAQEMMTSILAETGYLHASSQRNPKAGNREVDYSLKGAADVDGATIGLIEQAMASCGTIKTILPDHLDNRCSGKPVRIMIGVFNTCHESIMTIRQAFPDAIVLALMLHGGMDEHKYLIHPGCGDVGRMDAGVPDELTNKLKKKET